MCACVYGVYVCVSVYTHAHAQVCLWTGSEIEIFELKKIILCVLILTSP